jgi:hypothetical protein
VIGMPLPFIRFTSLRMLFFLHNEKNALDALTGSSLMFAYSGIIFFLVARSGKKFMKLKREEKLRTDLSQLAKPVDTD